MWSSGKDIPADVKAQILQDPAVIAAMRKAGGNALSDPKVREQIENIAKQKGYEAFEYAKNFVQDPEVQKQAKECVANAAAFFVHQIEQGPAGIRVLSFIAGSASFCLGIFRVVMSTISLSLFMHPINYVIAIYQILFSFTTALFEASPDTISKIQQKTGIGLDSYRSLLIDEAKFISFARGRGLFYMFQGSLWLSVATWTELLSVVCGLSLVFVGVCNLLVSYGMFDSFKDEVSQKYHDLKDEKK